MKNELWMLLDSMEIYEIKELTGSSTAGFAFLVILLIALGGIGGYLIIAIAFVLEDVSAGINEYMNGFTKEMLKQSAKNSYEYKKENGEDM